MTEKTNDLSAILQRFAALHEPRVIKLAGDGTGPQAEVLVLPEGLETYPVKPLLNPYRERPERRQGEARLLDLASFIGHVKRFADSDSAIFAVAGRTTADYKRGDTNQLLAVYDYHRQGATAEPRFGEHRAKHHLKFSAEWDAWVSREGKPMEQGEFAAFIEDRIMDILPPEGASIGDEALQERVQDLLMRLGGSLASPAKMIELSRGLQVNVEATIKQTTNLASGEGAIVFEESHRDSDGKPLKIPTAFLIGVPVFYGDLAYRLPVRLRYRKSGGKLVWFYNIWQADQAIEGAFRRLIDKIVQETSLPVFLGEPEK